MRGIKGVFHLISCRNAVSRVGSSVFYQFQILRSGSGIERCSYYRLMCNNDVNVLGRFQMRYFSDGGDGGEGNEPTKIYKEHHLKGAGRISEENESSKVEDIYTFCNLLDSSIKEKNIAGMLEASRRLEEAKIPMDVVRCNMLLRALLLVGAFKEANAFYKSMRGMDLVPNSITYSTMIEGYCKTGHIEEALKIFDEFRNSSVSSAACYIHIVNALCKKGMIDTAREVFVEFCEKGLDLDIHMFRTLMYSLLGREGEEGILNLVYRIESLNLDSSVMIFNDAIMFLCKRGSFEAAIEVFMVMRSKGVAVTSESYYMILTSLISNKESSLTLPLMTLPLKLFGLEEPKVGKMILFFLCLKDTGKALIFLRMMRERELADGFPSVVLKTLVKDLRALDAYFLVIKSEENVRSLDVVDYAIIIHGLCKEGFPRKALDLCVFAQHRGIALNIVVYNSVIYGLCHQGCLVEAFRLFDSLENIGIYPSEVTYGTLIDNLCKEGYLSDAEKLLEKMVSKGLNPNIIIYNSMIDGYCKMAQMDNALIVLSEMKARLLRPDAFTVSSMIKGYYKRGDMEEALRVFSKFKDEYISPDFFGYLFLIKGFCSKGGMEEARSVLRDMLVAESVVELLDRVDTEIESESIKGFLFELCEEGRILQAIKILEEIGSAFFLADKTPSFCQRSKLINKPSESSDLDVLEEAVWKEDSLQDFQCLYNAINSLCSQGKLKKANDLIRSMVCGRHD